MKLVLPKSGGGIGLPDLQRYYWAVHLARVVDWRLHTRCKGWVLFEQLISAAELRLIPWFSKKYRTSLIHTHPLIGATLQAFDRACKIHAISDKDCAITPIKGNQDFHPGMAKAFLLVEWPYAEMQAKHFYSRGRFLHQGELATLSNTKSFPFWAYIQLKHYLDNAASRGSFTKPPTILESLCSSSSVRHVISVLYASMFKEPYASLRSEHVFWETKLNMTIKDTSWDRVHLYIHKGSLNVHTQENGYKIK